MVFRNFSEGYLPEEPRFLTFKITSLLDEFCYKSDRGIGLELFVL